MLLGVAGALVALWTMSSGAAAGTESACTNETIRSEQHAGYLPDCRAYELVSPGSNAFLEGGRGGGAESTRSAINGDGILYYSRYPANGVTRSGAFYLAARGSEGWSIEEVAPQDSPKGAEFTYCNQSVYFSADLSHELLTDGWNAVEETPGESYCQSSEEALAAGAPAGYGNLFLRAGVEPYQLVNITPEDAAPANARLQDATGDFGHVLFEEKAQLTPEAPAGLDLYEWADGAVVLASVLPEGKPTAGKLANGGNAQTEAESVYDGHQNALAPATHAVSADGETVFFYAEHEGGVDLYVRRHAMQPQSAVNGEGVCTEAAKACTAQVDVSHGAGSSGGGVFWDASEDGTRVFFADERRLTANAGAAAEKPDLYEYEVETRHLTDLTPPAGESADVRGFSGASEDGFSYVYFVADGVLTGAQQNSEGAVARTGHPNLYMLHGGAPTFVATLNAKTDVEDWQEKLNLPHESNGRLTARVSSSGRYVGFTSTEAITGFENRDANTGAPDAEVFLYDAATGSAGQLSCVSCDPAGGQPIGPTELPAPTRFANGKANGTPVYLSRNVLDDGRVLFTTPNALAPQDSNGVADIYEYDEGRLSLISPGTASGRSVFYDASASGGDVFFVTSQGLVRADTDNSDSLYDARVEGGFHEPPLPPTGCASEEECRPAGPAFSSLPPATRLFTGKTNQQGEGHKAGAVRKCARGRVRRHGRCVKRRRRRRRRREKSRRTHR